MDITADLKVKSWRCMCD